MANEKNYFGRIPLRDGMRIRLIRGRKLYPEQGTDDHEVFLAGKVPVGSVGTVKKRDRGLPFEVIWDGISSTVPDGYFGFGDSADGDMYEEITL